jgi:uncharacterized protein
VRAVLDANVIVSAALSRDGVPARLIERWLHGEFELIVSPQLLEEVERALAYPKVARRLDDDSAARLLALLIQLAEHVPDPAATGQTRSRDRGDDYLVALASSTRATLVTGDAHLLELAGSMPIVSPRAFLDGL